MQHQLIYDSSVNLDPAWDAVEGPVWPQEVRVAYQEHMQSFHQATAITVWGQFCSCSLEEVGEVEER